MIKIKAVGDLMPGGILSGTNSDFVTERVRHYLDDADIRVGTLECSIGNKPTFCEKKRKHSSAFVYAKEEDLKRIKYLGFDAVSLANNHFFDLGEDGAIHTVELLKQLNIKYFGAGKTLEEAEAPLVYDINGETVAFLGFCDMRLKHMQFATNISSGVNPMEKNHVIKSIQEAKKQYDYVVVVVHWGKEHTWWPRPHVVRMAKTMRKAGASLILGDHPHRIQSFLNNRECPVAFSLGNFLFPDRMINTPYVTYYAEEDIDVFSLPKVYGFERVSEPSLKLWPDISNIGMLLEASFESGRIMAEYKLTQIKREGLVDFYSDADVIKRRLSRLSFLIRLPFYSFVIKSIDIISEYYKKGRVKAKSMYCGFWHSTNRNNSLG